MKERKFVLVNLGPRGIEIRADYTFWHRDLVTVGREHVLGGGFWRVTESGEVCLYDSSSDFGDFRPHIDEALRTDGKHFLERIGEVEEMLSKDGSTVDLTEAMVYYTGVDGEKVYPEIGQINPPVDEGQPVLPDPVPIYDHTGVAIKVSKHRGGKQEPKDALKKKKARRRATKKRYGKH